MTWCPFASDNGMFFLSQGPGCEQSPQRRIRGVGCVKLWSALPLRTSLGLRSVGDTGTISSKAPRTSGVVGLFQGTCVWAKLLQSCPTLATPWTVALQAPSSVHGISLQARIPEWVAIPSSRGSFQPREGTMSLKSPSLAGRFFTTSATREALQGTQDKRYWRTSVTEDFTWKG